MTDATPAPDLEDVLKDSPKNWGKWGDDDEVGAPELPGPRAGASLRPA